MRWVRCAVLLLVAAAAACRSSSAEVSLPIGFDEGNRAPSLEGVDTGGEPFVLDASGRPRVLVFYSSVSCGLCRVQLENLQAHLPVYDREGAMVMAATLDSPADSHAFRGQSGIDYPIVSVDSSTFEAWAPRDSALGGPLPATYILDGSGVIVFRYVGRNASDRVSDAALVSILADLKRP